MKRVNDGFLFVLRGPDLYMDWDKMEGQPYSYYTFGVCCCEVELDCLTGDFRVRTHRFNPSNNVMGILGLKTRLKEFNFFASCRL